MRRAEENVHHVSPLVTWAASGMMCTLICVGLLFIFAFFVAREVLPESMVAVLSPVALLMASFVSSYFTSKAQGKALITGLIQGLVNLSFCYLTGIIVFLRVVPKVLNPYCFFACMVGALLGGFVSAGVRPRRHKIK